MSGCTREYLNTLGKIFTADEFYKHLCSDFYFKWVLYLVGRLFLSIDTIMCFFSLDY